MISAEIRGLVRLRQNLRAIQKDEEKALTTAIKVEGYRLMRLLKTDIRKNSPGGRKMAPKSILARNLNYGSYLAGERQQTMAHYRMSSPKALMRMALAVRYWVDDDAMHIGWTGPKISNSWKKIAILQQEGFTQNMPSIERRWAANIGGKMPEGSRNRKFMFLRKSTTQFKTPARPIIDPFWAAHQAEVWQNIRDNYRRKLKGERI